MVIYKHFILKEKDLKKRYGKGSWVMITGGDSGQGKRYAIEFAKRGFNIILCGFPSSNIVTNHIKQKYHVETEVIECNFINAWKKDFFVDFEKAFKNHNISILVNNVGYRTGWKGYENMPDEEIKNTIAVGTIAQSILTKLALKHFRKRHDEGLYKSAIINITSQSVHYPLIPLPNRTTLWIPYLSVYDAANAYGFFHGNSIYSEYGHMYDILNITPGAILTKNTPYLDGTIGAIPCKLFVRNCIKLLGNINGQTCGYWLHEILSLFIGFAPEQCFFPVGDTIATEFMKTHEKNALDKYV